MRIPTWKLVTLLAGFMTFVSVSMDNTGTGHSWNAQAPTIGSYTLTLSSATPGATSASGTTYSYHGTMDATLLPNTTTGATGTITMHMTF